MELEETPEYKSYMFRANHARGWVISYTILLERVLDDFIATAFSDTQDKKIDLIKTLISEGMNYNSKVKIVLRLIRRHIPDEKTREIRFPGIKKDLQDIATDRNKFAHEIHYTQLNRENLMRFEICLVNFKELDKTVGYTKDDILVIVNRIQKYIDIIGDIRQEIWAQ